MFILNNIHEKDHRKIYGKLDNKSSAIFDISEKQINQAINSEWNEIQVGDLACIIFGSYKMSTVYRIDSIECAGADDENGKIYVLRGEVVGKIPNPLRYTKMLNKYQVKHEKLKNNKFSIGFNVCNLGLQLDSVEIKTNVSANTIGELKSALTA
jgi:hypothetical protein